MALWDSIIVIECIGRSCDHRRVLGCATSYQDIGVSVDWWMPEACVWLGGGVSYIAPPLCKERRVFRWRERGVIVGCSSPRIPQDLSIFLHRSVLVRGPIVTTIGSRPPARLSCVQVNTHIGIWSPPGVLTCIRTVTNIRSRPPPGTLACT